MAETTETGTETGAAIKCVLCDSVAVTDKDFCHGCKSYVCEACGESPLGDHEPSDHMPPCDTCGEFHPTDECPNAD